MTPEAYLAELPTERRAAVAAVREVIRAHLPDGYAESVQGGMLVYGVPLSRYPKAPKKQPIWYAALGSHKSFCSLYLMSVYGSREHLDRLRAAFLRAGKKLDMGKSCIHFHDAGDLPLDTIGELIASIPMDRWIALFEATHRPRNRKRV
jgi:hypothetical protein